MVGAAGKFEYKRLALKAAPTGARACVGQPLLNYQGNGILRSSGQVLPVGIFGRIKQAHASKKG